MKKIILSSVAIATLSFGYEGCGKTQSEALNALSKSIYVSVKNNLSKKESYSKSMFSTFFNKKIDSSSSQSSSVIIKNAKFSPSKDGQICASVSEKDVKDNAEQIFKEIKIFKISSLPNSFEEKKKKINSMLEKIAFVRGVLKLKEKDLKMLEEKEKKLSDEALTGYEGCGKTKSEALDSLAKSIYTNVNNSINKKESYSKSMFSTFFSKKVDVSSSQSSSVIVKNVTFSTKNNEVCAFVSKKDVEKNAKKALEEIRTFKMSSLPNTFEEKIKKVNSMLSKIAFVKAVLTLNEKDLTMLNKKWKELSDEASNGAVVFNVNDVNAKITISNYNKTISPSKEIELKEGKYSYKIVDKNKCPVEGEFEVKKGKLISIKKDLGDYPQISFKSNMPANAINIKLDGTDMKLNKTKTLKKCKGEVLWSMTYADQKEDGSISLKPDLKKVVEEDFISVADLKKLKEKTAFFTRAPEIDINYGYVTNSNDTDYTGDDLRKIEVDYFKNMGIYKFGGGIAVASPKDFIAKDINEVELLLNLRVQLPEIADTQLRVGKFPFIPYFGASTGVDVYNILNEFDFSDTPAIFRGVVGFNILLHKQFGLNFNYQKGFMDKKDNVFEAGIVLSF